MIFSKKQTSSDPQEPLQRRQLIPTGWLRPLVTLGLSLIVSALPISAAQKPNILWIFVEDLSPYLGCYGDPVNKDHTPTIDQMARDGVLFKRTFMPAPVCSPCRSAMITGVMQTSTGTHQHRSSRHSGPVVPEALRIHLPEGMKTIPELMKDAGYFTFNSGKDDYNFHYDRRELYHVGHQEGYQPGMNQWQGNRAEHVGSLTKGTWSARPNKNTPWFGQILLKGGKARDEYVREGQKLSDPDVSLPPYFPKTAPLQKYWTMHYNAVRGTDKQVEDILAQLKKDNELENTLIFFFSDHGNNQSLRHKQFCYDGGLHVPLIITGNHPALKTGTVRSELVSGLDIPATTLALAGAEMPKHLDGQNLFGSNYQKRKFIISARDRCDYTIDRIRTVRTERFRYIRNYFPKRAMLQAQYRDEWPPVLELKRLKKEKKLTAHQEQLWFGTRPKEELYDVSTDPHQIKNLATDAAHQKTLHQHRAILDQWIVSSGDKGQVTESAEQLKATYDLWKDLPIFKNAKVNPEYDQFRSIKKN